MKYLLSFLLPALFLMPVAAQNRFPVSEIPDSLLKNAHTVVRDHQLKFEVLNPGEAITTEYKVMTLLDESAQSYNQVVFYYSSLDEIEDISAAVYDATGKLIRRLKKKDISDVKPPEYFINDHRCKVLNLPSSAYPYTIEYAITERSHSLMFYPAFAPQQSATMSVQHARLEMVMPAGMDYRVKEVALPEHCRMAPNTWEFNNILAFKPEMYTPSAENSAPFILTAPNEFELDGISGDMRTWQSFGAFINKINSSRDQLSPETIKKVQQLVADCPDQTCKIQRIYQYLQDNTRYFFVGLGIGGWQPASAQEVDQYKYGDCKGLSNYTHALLKALGVPSYYALIRAGEDEQQQYPDFPNPWFNHATLCVPNAQDTLWLECTSQQESWGFNSDFTDNRSALLITPEGGQLIRTPAYNEKHNTVSHNITIAINIDGSAQWVSNDSYKGIQQILPAEIADKQEDQQKKALYQLLNISDFEITKLELIRKKGPHPEVNQSLSLVLPKFASVSGKRLFVPACVPASPLEIPTASELPRKMSVQADPRGYTTGYHTTLLIPEGYHLESAAEPVDINSPFGHFSLQFATEPGKITVSRQLIINSSIQPASTFPALIDFLKAIGKAEKTKLVLVKTT